MYLAYVIHIFLNLGPASGHPCANVTPGTVEINLIFINKLNLNLET